MRNQERIFIVEDDVTIVGLLQKHLSQHYYIKSVINFRAIIQEVEEFQPDLILMDITLPYFNGFYWTTEIRKTMTMPIIFLSSADDEMNAVMAMNMGGDDFVSKPFSLPILDAKIAAFLRRANSFSKQKYKVEHYQLSLNGILINNETHETIQLTPTETKILSLLIEHQGQAVSKEALLNHLWEGEDFIDQNTLNVNMTRLRKKALSLGFDRIHTVRGVGYLIQ
ncbi:response regulator transcription factor [Streptococcus macacae]|uniref:Transcriptional regulatory protein, C-terminal domain protein n=1 Tax=Streptococcus macacae NCTC 11558 TaxID=764298 RepID=G5JU93_9STRE|nr:response regulator transcription factor [Streptococcus macacae]EHJ51710.1 transcriptional regulatory protein, C-terminal domain protein [Streptococcus macacae NCTC 11558]SUN78456.1 response regulator [Streptococcus macacae NCTC 11558]